jgi:hypothetical protein
LDVRSYLSEVWTRQWFPKSNGTEDPFRRGSSLRPPPIEVYGGTRGAYENGHPASAALKRGIGINPAWTFLSGGNVLRQQPPYFAFEPQLD